LPDASRRDDGILWRSFAEILEARQGALAGLNLVQNDQYR